MTPRSFWLILIKLVGVWLLFSNIISIPQIFATIFMQTFSGDITGDFSGTMTISLYSIVACAVIFGAIWFLIFKSNVVADKLKLDEGFQEEKFEFNISQNSILRIAIIVIGGILFAETLPAFANHLITYLNDINQPGIKPNTNNKGWIIFTLGQVIVAYLLMTNSAPIVRFIERKKAED